MWKTSFVPFHDLFIDYVKTTSINNMRVQHYHDSYEIYLQLSGERYLFHDDICYTLKKGDLVIFKPFDIHYTQSMDSEYYERYVLNFQPEKLGILLSKSELNHIYQKLPSGILHLNDDETEELSHLLGSIADMTKKRGLLSQKRLYSYVFLLLSNIIDASIPDTSLTPTDLLLSDTPMINANGEELELHSKEVIEPLDSTSKKHMIQPEIIEAIQYINNNYREQITLDDLTKVTHLSKYHFCRVFHQVTGATFYEYLSNVRLTKVHQLLMNTDLTLRQIAEKSGFTSSSHMNRVFQKVYEMSPREFRSKNKGKKEM